MFSLSGFFGNNKRNGDFCGVRLNFNGSGGDSVWQRVQNEFGFALERLELLEFGDDLGIFTREGRCHFNRKIDIRLSNFEGFQVGRETNFPLLVLRLSGSRDANLPIAQRRVGIGIEG